MPISCERAERSFLFLKRHHSRATESASCPAQHFHSLISPAARVSSSSQPIVMKPLQVHKTLALCAALVSLLPATTSLAAAAPHGSNAEPTVIFTHKRTSSEDTNPPPAWLTVPTLLDIQPMLLQVDVRRDVAAQLRRFCHSHSIDVTKCGVLLDALNEFVDFNRLCSPQKAKQDEPSFMIIKNLIVSVPSHNNERQPKSTFTWMQDDAQSIAADLCRFAQTGGDVKSRVRANLPCVLALEAALLRSLAWINSLESCDLIAKQRANAAQTPSRDEYESSALTTRVTAVEQSIAAMKTKSEQQHNHSEEQSVAELPEATPWMARDEASNTEDTLEEAHAVDQERPSTADPTFHQSSSLTDHAIESNINSNDGSEKETSTSQEADFESKVIEDIATSPPDVPAEISRFARKEDDDVVSSTSNEGQPVVEGNVHAEDLSVNSLLDDSVAETINPDKEPSSSIGHDGDDDQHAAQDQVRDVIEADKAGVPETSKREDRETSAIVKRESDGERPSLDENDLSSGPSTTALEDLPASRSSVEEFSTPIKKTEASVDRMRSPIAVEAIGILLHPDEEALTPSPDVLEVLSTLAMLFFVFYLVFDLLSIATSNFVETLRTHGGQAAQALFPLFSRSESKNTSVRENAVAPLPERDGSDKESLSLASSSTPRALVNLIFASSAPREQRVSFQRRAEVIEKVTKSYVLRLQKAAFGVWRVGTMSIGPNVALVQRESSEDLSTESTNAIESVQRQPINPTDTLSARTNFTCVAMALMFARHGAIFHPIDQVRDDDSIITSRMTTTPELSLALSQLLEGRRDCAVRRIQQTWRSRHKKQGVKLSITTDSSSNSFQPHTTTTASAPSTPLFALLTKDLRKRPIPKASVTPRLNFAVRRVMTPASSTHLPPAS